MNSLIASPGVAQMIARQTIQDRIEVAERGAQVHAVRAARRAERRAARQARATTSSQRGTHQLPQWAARVLRPAR
jgi:hypothetical protein